MGGMELRVGYQSTGQTQVSNGLWRRGSCSIEPFRVRLAARRASSQGEARSTQQTQRNGCNETAQRDATLSGELGCQSRSWVAVALLREGGFTKRGEGRLVSSFFVMGGEDGWLSVARVW